MYAMVSVPCTHDERVEIVSLRVEFPRHLDPLSGTDLARVLIHQHFHLQIGERSKLGDDGDEVEEQLTGLEGLCVIAARAGFEHGGAVEVVAGLQRLGGHAEGAAGVEHEDGGEGSGLVHDGSVLSLGGGKEAGVRTGDQGLVRAGTRAVQAGGEGRVRVGGGLGGVGERRGTLGEEGLVHGGGTVGGRGGGGAAIDDPLRVLDDAASRGDAPLGTHPANAFSEKVSTPEVPSGSTVVHGARARARRREESRAHVVGAKRAGRERRRRSERARERVSFYRAPCPRTMTFRKRARVHRFFLLRRSRLARTAAMTLATWREREPAVASSPAPKHTPRRPNALPAPPRRVRRSSSRAAA